MTEHHALHGVDLALGMTNCIPCHTSAPSLNQISPTQQAVVVGFLWRKCRHLNLLRCLVQLPILSSPDPSMIRPAEPCCSILYWHTASY